jgi:fructan beta-fructosidase
MIVSPEFQITTDYINFLVGGGNHPYLGSATNPPTAVNLVVDSQVLRTSTGQDSEALNWTNGSVSKLKGRTARIEIADQSTSGWGHINADQFVFADQPAFLRSIETAVNLLVDGEVVRTATGPNSETLDWSNWNVRDLIGKDVIDAAPASADSTAIARGAPPAPNSTRDVPAGSTTVRSALTNPCPSVFSPT